MKEYIQNNAKPIPTIRNGNTFGVQNKLACQKTYRGGKSKYLEDEEGEICLNCEESSSEDLPVPRPISRRRSSCRNDNEAVPLWSSARCPPAGYMYVPSNSPPYPTLQMARI